MLRLMLALSLLVMAAILAFMIALEIHGNSRKAFVELVPTDHKVVLQEQLLSDKTKLDQPATNTLVGSELDKIMQGKDKDIDLALANWLIAADIPEFHDLTREAYFARVDSMTEQVRISMTKMQASGYGGMNSDDPETRCQRFCSAIIGLRFSYAEEFREEDLTPAQMKELYANPDNISLAGLLRTRRGSCVSMPLLYLVIGQRLGMPVHLVTVGKHFFIRWEETGFRMNIETTSVNKIAWAPDDSVYLDAEGITRDRIRGSDLRNLTSREVVGELFFTRMAYWHTKNGKCETQRLHDLACARQFAPDDPVIEQAYQVIVNHHVPKSEFTLADGVPAK